MKLHSKLFGIACSAGADCVLSQGGFSETIAAEFPKGADNSIPVRKIASVTRFLATVTVAVAVCALSAQSRAAQLIGFTDQNWRYYEAGNQPADKNGVNWKAPMHDDSGWKSGYGFFAYEPDTPAVYNPVNTSLTLSNAGATEITRTFYFRAHFDFAGDPANVFLYFTNVVDDGCVVYLNGSRIYDLRVSKVDPTYDDLASGGPAAEGNREFVTVFNSPNLQQGDNVLAAEVKQLATTSSDVAWNLALAYSRPEAVAITKQPLNNLDVVEFDDPVLSVDVAGADPRYRWYRDDVFLTGQTNRTLALVNIRLTQAGTYYVVVSNAVNTVRSSNTVIRVVPDTFGPRILNAYVPVGESTRVLIQFDEDIMRFAGVNNTNRSGFNTTNYWITILGQTNQLVVTQAIVGVGNAAVRLTVETNFNQAANYQICISNITDLRTNTIAWNSCVPIGFEAVTNPIVYGDLWSYHEWGFPPEGDWRVLNYVEDPFRWTDAPGLFRTPFLGGVMPPCAVQGWTMSAGYCAYYFRKKFVLPPNLAGLKMNVTLGHVVDDGAVFYLNGVELTRYNMPEGPVDYCTRAASGVVDALCRTVVFPNVLLARTNILAVELHELDPGTVNDIDAAFGASLTLNYIPYPPFSQPPNVRLRLSNDSPTHLTVYFTNGFGQTIQSKTNLTDPWREVQPMTNRLTTPKSNPHRFFRLHKAH